MTKKKWAITGGVAIAVIAATIIGRQLIGKSESASNTTASSTSDGVITLKVAHTQSYAPYDFINEKGESDGFEVAVLKAIDEKLDAYQFEYVGTSDEDLLIGLESGKYDIGTKGAWYTAERAEKFIIPENAIGASIIGFTIRKEDSSKYTDIDSFAAAGGKLAPISPQNAQYNVIQEYNKDSSTPIKLAESESFTVADAYAWVLEGRYDAFFDIELAYKSNVVDENGAYHKFNDQLAYVRYKAIPTYPIFNKKNQELANAYDKAIEQVTQSGKIKELEQKYFGEDLLQLVAK